jgi:hypothetical protein
LGGSTINLLGHCLGGFFPSVCPCGFEVEVELCVIAQLHGPFVSHSKRISVGPPQNFGWGATKWRKRNVVLAQKGEAFDRSGLRYIPISWLLVGFVCWTMLTSWNLVPQTTCD